MPAKEFISEGTLYAFLLVLARVSGVFVLVPLPGMQSGTEFVRIGAALAITVALFPFWPHATGIPITLGLLLPPLAAEAVFGLAIGLTVSIVSEIVRASFQIVSQQAGFNFASTIDPTTSVDTNLMVVTGQLIGSLLFLSLGLDREMIRVFALSLSLHPPGSITPNLAWAEALRKFASDIFAVGVRLSMPVIALLALVDLSLALLGRINSQLQLIHLAFPLKMLGAILLVAVLAGFYPGVIRQESNKMLELSRHLAGLANYTTNGR